MRRDKRNSAIRKRSNKPLYVNEIVKEKIKSAGLLPDKL